VEFRGIFVRILDFPGNIIIFEWIKLWTWCRALWTKASSGAQWTGGQRWRQACRSAALPASPWPEYRREGPKRWRGVGEPV
jgi:hypothetical protein